VNIVIMGCGRVGATLALGLEQHGHSVAVIDVDVNAFRRLGPDFQGRTVKGVGFDRDVLVKAGIKDADGFAAVSNGDNSNILAARVVREEFGLDNVVARIYDHGRAEIYERLGIPAIATVRWAAVQVMSRLVKTSVEPVWRDPSGATVVLAPRFHPGWVGMSIGAIAKAARGRAVTMLRLGQGIIPDDAVLLQDGDVLYLSLSVEDVAATLARLAAAPEQA